MPASSRRFRNAGETLDSYREPLLVRCPRCGGRAVFRHRTNRLGCQHCGATTCHFWHESVWIQWRCYGCKRWIPPNRRAGADNREQFVDCPGCKRKYILRLPRLSGDRRSVQIFSPAALWLQTACAGNILWACNEHHLSAIRTYVTAELRERMPNVNRSMVSSLPTWVKLAKNRTKVLRAIGRLEKRLKEGSP